jgi:hypothetical protein
LTLLDRSKTDWDLIVLTECWLRHSYYIPSLDGYCFAQTENNLTQNEGIVVYFKDYMNIEISEPNIRDANCLMLKINPNIVIVLIYRPPGYKDVSLFMESLNELLTSLKYSNIMLMGDINIDILPNSKDAYSTTYLNLLASHGLLPAHILPTHSKTCLDHAMIKSSFPAYCYVAETSVTDHNSVIFILKYQHLLSSYKNCSRRKIDFIGLDNDMKNLCLATVFGINDANTATTFILSEINAKIKSNTKIISIPNRKRINKPWMTSGLLRCVRNRDRLHKKFKKYPNDEVIKVTYKRYRNFCNWLLKKLKRDYENDLLQTSAKINNKALWDTIKTVTHSSKTTKPADKLISSTDPFNSVYDINNFFVSIGRELAEKASMNGSSDTSSSSPRTHFSFVLIPTDEDEVTNCILNLKKDHSSGRDEITGAILKRYRNILVPPITYIFNLILSSGTFPDQLKLAEVIPIHKGGDGGCVNNFRPISKLHTLAKVLEKLINKRLINYLETKKLLSCSQFGFRAGTSTSDAVHELTDYIVANLDQKKKVIAIFLDLAKAFDTVSVPILVNKLETLGIRGTQLKLFKNY